MSLVKRIPLLIAAAVVFSIAIPAAAAIATYTPVAGVSTDDASAGAHANFTTTYSQPANSATALGCTLGCLVPVFPEPDVKTIVQTLPKGFLANPKATPYCDPASSALPTPGFFQWSCPANTQIGTETITVLVCGAVGCGPASLVAKVYNAAPGTADKDGNVVSNEQGHLVAIGGVNAIDPANVPNARLDINVSLSGGDTLVATADNIPQVTAVSAAEALALGGCTPVGTFFVCALHISGIDFLQNGATGTAPNQFLTNPTFCSANSFTGAHTSYAPTETATNTVEYTTTNCNLALNPTFDLSFSTYKRGSIPAITGVVTQSPTEAAVKEATINFSKGFGVSTKNTLTQCPASLQGTGQTTPACDAASKMGTVSINGQQIPDAYGPLFGNVYLGEKTGSRQFNVLASASGFFPLVVRGDAGGDTTTGILTNQFRDLPAATLTSFVLNLAGGTAGLAVNPIVCAPATITADFLAHSGQTAQKTDTVNITGCKRATLKLGLKPRKRGSHPTMTLDTSSTGTVILRVTQQLARGLRWKSNIRRGSKQVLGNLWLTTSSGTEKVKMKQSKSKKYKKKRQVLLTGKRKDGKRVKAKLYRSKKGKPQITMSGLPETSTLLTGVKLRLYGKKNKWLTLPRKCKKMEFKSTVKDVYNTTKSSKVKRTCKR